jgi:hypothetical protein
MPWLCHIPGLEWLFALANKHVPTLWQLVADGMRRTVRVGNETDTV